MSLTGIILVIVMCILGIYDFAAFVFGGESSTISRTMELVGLNNPGIILVIGYLLGHIFSPMKCTKCIEREKDGRL
jgi:hypothetical protein